jgi:hypothetical protein
MKARFGGETNTDYSVRVIFGHVVVAVVNQDPSKPILWMDRLLYLRGLINFPCWRNLPFKWKYFSSKLLDLAPSFWIVDGAQLHSHVVLHLFFVCGSIVQSLGRLIFLGTHDSGEIICDDKKR